MRAIVLSGGGARGAYQAGVWKALRKLKIDYDIVTGTSIGSVNGLMMVQNDYLKTMWFWSNISFELLYDEKFPNKYDTLIEKTEIYKNYAKHFLKKGGISMGKMRNLLIKFYHKKKFFDSKINYGLVTFNLSKMEPQFISKNDLNDDVVDYILASACCYPAFQKMKIKGEEYIDGGVYDNIPINMAIEMGADEVIAVDLEAIGIKQDIKYDNVKVTYIRPRNDIGSFLVFDKKIARRGIKYGYFDTMKIYNKLDGDTYTFKHGTLDENYRKYYHKFLEYCDILFKKDEGIYTNVLKLSFFSRMLKTRNENELKKIFNETIEFLGKIFEIDDCHIYDIKKYNKILKDKNKKQYPVSKELIFDKINKREYKDLLKTASIVKYLYNALEKDENHKELCTLATLFPKEFVGALYLKVIK